MPTLTPFAEIRQLAEQRKGGQAALEKLLGKPLTPAQLKKLPDDRYLAMMTRCIFQAGFNWKVIEHKWAGFEEAFHGFNPRGLAYLAPEKWDAYADDARIVRNRIKLEAVRANAVFVMEESECRGGFGRFIADWPPSDQVGLMAYLGKHASRLGGSTAQYFLRFIGKDSFVLSRDVIARLRASGIEIRDNPTSRKDLRLVQETFNAWHRESGLPYSHLSRIAAFSIGQNRP